MIQKLVANIKPFLKPFEKLSNSDFSPLICNKINMNQLSASKEVTSKTTTLLKPTNEIAKIISNEHIKNLELSEYCKILECDLKKWQKKIRALNSSINESTRTKDEYKSRNKINIINSESLLQALNELNKYKCELKSIYIATDKVFKAKTFKYKNIITAYDSAWKNALREYNTNPLFVELLKFQQENTILEKEVQRQENLKTFTEAQFIQLKESIQQTFLEKILEFSKVMIRYKEFLNSPKRNKKNEFKDCNRNFEFKIFRADGPSFTGKPAMTIGSNDEANVTCSIDISVFDDMMVPSDNLESQTLEEDSYVLIRQDENQYSEVSKDQEEELEYLSNYEQIVEPRGARIIKNTKKNLMQNDTKVVAGGENESQYFKQKTLECLEKTQTENIHVTERQHLLEDSLIKQRKNDETLEDVGGTGKLKPALGNPLSAVLQQTVSEEEIPRDTQMEYEESLGEESYEKQFGNQRENYERQYQKTSSLSSDDSTPTGDNFNESAEKQKPSFKPRSEPEKNDFKPFSGFFTLGNENEPSTPSIFKLF